MFKSHQVNGYVLSSGMKPSCACTPPSFHPQPVMDAYLGVKYTGENVAWDAFQAEEYLCRPALQPGTLLFNREQFAATQRAGICGGNGGGRLSVAFTPIRASVDFPQSSDNGATAFISRSGNFFKEALLVARAISVVKEGAAMARRSLERRRVKGCHRKKTRGGTYTASQ